jgi:L-iditol 2-dehydrogenase
VLKVRIVGEKKAELVEVPDPRAIGDYVVVKILSAPMCTEYKAFRDGRPGESIGHEAAGEVVEVAQPGRVAVGDRVAVMPLSACGRCDLCLAGEYIHCQNTADLREATGYTGGGGTYAQYILKADWLLVPIPEGMSFDHGSLACCGLGPTFGAMELMGVDRFHTVLITGLGPVGLGGVINAVYRGARVIGVEGNPYRSALARDLGAEMVIDPEDPEALAQIMALTHGRGADRGVDCSGVPQAQRLLIDAARRKGEIAFVGEGGDLSISVSRDMIRKGLTLRGSWHYPLSRSPRMMSILEDVGEQLDRQITHTFPMDQVQSAFELQLTGQSGKVILHPWE